MCQGARDAALGHHAGDRLLAAVADVQRQELLASDTPVIYRVKARGRTVTVAL